MNGMCCEYDRFIFLGGFMHMRLHELPATGVESVTLTAPLTEQPEQPFLVEVLAWLFPKKFQIVPLTITQRYQIQPIGEDHFPNVNSLAIAYVWDGLSYRETGDLCQQPEVMAYFSKPKIVEVEKMPRKKTQKKGKPSKTKRPPPAGAAPFLFLGAPDNGNVHTLSIAIKKYKMKKDLQGVFRDGKPLPVEHVYNKRQVIWPGVKEGRSIPVFVHSEIHVDDRWLRELPTAVVDSLWPKGVAEGEASATPEDETPTS